MPTVLTERVEVASEARFGLITTRSDEVLTLSFNYPIGRIAPAIDRLVTEQYVGDDRLNAFVEDGTEHVLSGNLDRATPDGVRLGDWIDGCRAGDADWGDTL